MSFGNYRQRSESVSTVPSQHGHFNYPENDNDTESIINEYADTETESLAVSARSPSLLGEAIHDQASAFNYDMADDQPIPAELGSQGPPPNYTGPEHHKPGWLPKGTSVPPPSQPSETTTDNALALLALRMHGSDADRRVYWAYLYNMLQASNHVNVYPIIYRWWTENMAQLPAFRAVIDAIAEAFNNVRHNHRQDMLRKEADESTHIQAQRALQNDVIHWRNEARGWFTEFKKAEAAHNENSILTAQIHALQARISDLEAENDNLKIMLQTTQANPGSGHDNAEPRYGSKRRMSTNPDVFDAKDQSAKDRNTAYTTWRTKIRLCWAYDKWCFPTERDKLMHIFVCLGKLPMSIIEPDMQPILNDDHPDTWKWKTAEELIAHLDNRYDTMNMKVEADRALQKLQMKNLF
ncbi:hypothetical protein QBC32DRAFT_384589 [Pseudoneurospora amorphoporcata]|uniref:Uncharacterized protein n=1 Tax=Pseudoneurospora amorphoporcata TaxID=241081 RepID=A0AAN6NNM4_9PEZI|nr:hypothetical protein QBC32DRAFT_384589 [Pseudoneurospora amorphoporcata]